MAKNLTTDNLVTTALRRALIPVDQSTFTCADIRDILNEEMSMYILPMVLRSHEEYYVVDEDISLSSGQTRYKIPYRAVGNKLRDVQYVTDSGNPYEMVRVSIEDRPEYQGEYGSDNYLSFYMQSDEVVLMQDAPCAGKLRMSYYLRPNDLVEDERGAKITAISNQFVCATISASVLGDTFSVAGTVFTGVASCPTSTQFVVTCSTSTTAGNLATAINTHTTVKASACATGSVVKIISDDNDGFTVTYTDNCAGCTVPATISCIRVEFTTDTFPDHFGCTSVYDFVQGRSPNIIKIFDICIVSSNEPTKTLVFNQSDLRRIDPFTTCLQNVSFSVGDYIMKAEEAIYPQLPTELQSVLAQRTAVKLLEALGDTEGMRNAQQELQRMEETSFTLIDNRVEGAPQKINNKKSLLRAATTNNLFRRRGL